IPNGGFENGEKGWQDHQWSGKAVAGTVDREDKFEGTQPFKFNDAGGGNRYMATDVKLPADVQQDYVLSFALKLQDVPEGAARVAIGIDGKGWLDAAKGKSESVKVGGTADWKEYTIAIPAKAVAGST